MVMLPWSIVIVMVAAVAWIGLRQRRTQRSLEVQREEYERLHLQLVRGDELQARILDSAGLATFGAVLIDAARQMGELVGELEQQVNQAAVPLDDHRAVLQIQQQAAQHSLQLLDLAVAADAEAVARLAPHLVAARQKVVDAQMRLASDPALADVRERLASVRAAVGDLGALLRSINALVPGDAGHEAVELRALLDELLLIVAGAGARDVVVQREYDGPVHVDASPAQLRQVFLHLLRNATQAMGGQGLLTIGISRPDAEHVTVAIVDNGPGFAADELAHACEPFYSSRVDRAGIGLFIVHQLVGAQGGNLRIGGGAAGGAHVEVTLPASRMATPVG